MNEADQVIQAMRCFRDLAEACLAGRELSRDECRYYRAHPDAWHQRMFHLSMTVLCEVRSLNRLAQGLTLANATKLPAGDLLNVLSLGPGPVPECVLDCWETDRSLAYQRFANEFRFPPPWDAPGA